MNRGQTGLKELKSSWRRALVLAVLLVLPQAGVGCDGCSEGDDYVDTDTFTDTGWDTGTDTDTDTDTDTGTATDSDADTDSDTDTESSDCVLDEDCGESGTVCHD